MTGPSGYIYQVVTHDTSASASGLFISLNNDKRGATIVIIGQSILRHMVYR
ncbi:MAG: hypothetical protein PUB18_04930 [bacterium]|nr:hypothetical protein [bacterium]